MRSDGNRPDEQDKPEDHEPEMPDDERCALAAELLRQLNNDLDAEELRLAMSLARFMGVQAARDFRKNYPDGWDGGE